MAHYHYGNGEIGCLYDTQEICATRGGAIATADMMFSDCLCDACYKDMMTSLKSRAAKDGVTYYFNRECENEDCNSGAALVSITKHSGGIKLGKFDELECNCG